MLFNERWWSSILCLFLCLIVTLQGPFESPLAAQEKQEVELAEGEDIDALLNPTMTKNQFAIRLVHLTHGELAEVAARWLTIVKQQTKSAAELNISLAAAKGPEAEQLLTDFENALGRRNRSFKKLGLVIEEWEAKGGKPEDIDGFKKYAAAVLRKEFKVTDPKTLYSLIVDWLTSAEGGGRVAVWLLSFIASLVFMSMIAWLLTRLVKRSLAKTPRISNLLRDFLSQIAFWLILSFGTVIVLTMFGFNMTPLLAIFGGTSFIVGFAMQSTLSNLASGLLLLINRPFDVGDTVDVAGVSGKVRKVNIVSTTIQSSENQVFLVPNTKVWGDVITLPHALPGTA